MRAFAMRFFRRAVPVVLVLAVIGYIIAEILLMFQRGYAGNASNPDWERARWLAPVRLSLLGLAFLFVLELIAAVLPRRQTKSSTASSPPAPPEANNP